MPDLAYLNLYLGTNRNVFIFRFSDYKFAATILFVACLGGLVKKVMFIDVPKYALQTFTLDVILP